MFSGKWVQGAASPSISTPRLARVKSTAAWMARWALRLQQRGPPTAPIRARAWDVIPLARPQGSPAKGVAPVAMETYIPALIPAPQAPQKPQAPPGTWLPRRSISGRACSRSRAPPALR